LSLLHAIILGIVQGLTEFLPISSSGHLILMREVFGWEIGSPAVEKSFDVALHFGTFLALAAYFWADIGRLLKGFFVALARRNLTADPNSKLAFLILLATIPAVIAGLFGEEVIENVLGNPFQVCALLVGFGLLLAWADRVGRKTQDLASVNWKEAGLIGLAQAIALAPGTSRSGVTITAGLALGLNREAAARFSFLISLPAIAGAAMLKLGQLFSNGLPAGLLSPMLAGALAAAISGFVAIAWLLRFLQTRSLMPFVYYRLLVGLGLIIFFLAR